MASIVVDRSCSENYIFPSIVSRCYILPQVEIPVLFKEKSIRKKKIFKLKIFNLLKYLLTSRSKIHIDSGAFVSSLEVS